MSSTKTIEQTYKKKDLHNHILTIPDTYISNITHDTIKTHFFDNMTNKIVYDKKQLVLALYKIVDEILVNSADQTTRNQLCNTIKLNIDETIGSIEVFNNGSTIPIAIHQEYNIYVPTMIFGELLTGENYDSVGKTTGGKNGYGAKLANIYSKLFIVEVIDSERKLKFVQKFTNNMYEKEEPIITVSKEPSSIKITFIPDYQRFGLTGLTEPMMQLFKKRIYDIAGTTNEKVKVYYNNELIQIKSFTDYVKMFYDDEQPIFYEKVNDRWQIAVIFSPDATFKHVSFVNNIATFQGGTHVKYITEQITDKITEKINSTNKNKNLEIKPADIIANMTIFINSVIEDPSFTSQIKDKLSSSVKTFRKGVEKPCEINEKFIKRLCDCGLLETVVLNATAKNNAKIEQTLTADKKNVKKYLNIPKLIDAPYATNSSKSKDCILILTEGDSAKTSAVSGLAKIDANFVGIFPLKGKPLNVREATKEQLLKNEELLNIIKILGLDLKCKYETDKEFNKLRYGKIMIYSDEDLDGYHIKGLLMNLFHYFCKGLLKREGFLFHLPTQIVKVTKGKEVIEFYSLKDLEAWKLLNKNSNYTQKYYKGLGTMTPNEAREAFVNFTAKIINYVWDNNGLVNNNNNNNANNNNNKNGLVNNNNNNDLDNSNADDNESVVSSSKPKKTKKKTTEELLEHLKTLEPSESAIILAFAKEYADCRKEWLKEFNPNTTLDITIKKVSYHDYVHNNLKLFSHADNVRSIPMLYDGLKPSQRKVLFAAFKRNLTSEIKVSQFAGYISEHSAYHHGEASLTGAIINMAQNFCGSNNINLLVPVGQFGSRIQGGKDSASPRYIFTKLSDITKKIFIPDDNYVLTYNDDDGMEIEPKTYYPIIPLILVNGADGIGTGYSTSIPCYNPIDVISNIRLILDDKPQLEMIPWYNGFTGKIEKNDKGIFECFGTGVITSENTMKITELPIGVWTDDYKTFLDDMVSKEKVLNPGMVASDYKVEFNIEFNNGVLQTLQKDPKIDIDKELKLKNSINITNMHLFKFNPTKNTNEIVKYNSPNDIITEFVGERLKIYVLRKEYIIKKLLMELDVYRYKRKYIKEICDSTIIVSNRSEKALIDTLISKKYPQLTHNIDKPCSYDYLTDLKLTACTIEQIAKLDELIKNKEEYLTNYQNKSTKQLWKEELIELENEYANFLEEYQEQLNDDSKTEVNKTIKTKTTKTKTKAK